MPASIRKKHVAVAFISLACQASAVSVSESESPSPERFVSRHEQQDLSSYFRSLHNAAALQSSDSMVKGDSSHSGATLLASLPVAAAGPVLKFDPSLFLQGTDPASEFTALLEAELAAQSVHPVPGTPFPYVLCGPLVLENMVHEVLRYATGEVTHEVRAWMF